MAKKKARVWREEESDRRILSVTERFNGQKRRGLGPVRRKERWPEELERWAAGRRGKGERMTGQGERGPGRRGFFFLFLFSEHLKSILILF
jgi:hypothetical protein